jgi:hypothetical protein
MPSHYNLEEEEAREGKLKSELFAEGDFEHAPTLADVVPGLIAPGASTYTAKELNPRRMAVSGRAFRTPTTRSALGSKYTEPEPYRAPYQDLIMAEGAGPGVHGAIGLYGTPDGDVGGDLGVATGNTIAGQMGMQGLASAAGTGLAGAFGGFGLDVIGPAMLGSFATAALNPALAANLGFGALAADLVGQQAVSNVADEQGLTPAVQSAAQSSAMGANMGLSGLIGMAVNALGGMFGLTASPMATAEEAALATLGSFGEANVGGVGMDPGTAALGGVSAPSPGQNFGGITSDAPGDASSSGGNVGTVGIGAIGNTTGHGGIGEGAGAGVK